MIEALTFCLVPALFWFALLRVSMGAPGVVVLALWGGMTLAVMLAGRGFMQPLFVSSLVAVAVAGIWAGIRRAQKRRR